VPKISFIGAGSTVFARHLLGDLLAFPELAASHIVLHDLDARRLATSETVASRVADALGARPRIEATTDRERALDGAGYVICMIQVGGYRPATVTDFDVPKRYGLRQTIADTLGVGGIMRGLRTIPVLLGICRDMERLCPDAWFLNYVNPMAMNCWALSRATPIRSVGLCHSVPGTAVQLAAAAGVPADEVDYLCAGINHLAFYLRFAHRGNDLYPVLRRIAEEGRAPAHDRVRYEVLRRFGYFVTESSEHLAEYVPWFIKRDRPDLVEHFNIPLDEYLRRCEAQISGWEALRRELEGGAPLEVTRSLEYASLIVHSLETGVPRTIHGNVTNHGLIANLPEGCCVEVPCAMDGAGIRPVAVGALPVQLAALMQTNVNVQALTVEAALTRRKEHVYHAAMLDPHTAAELDLEQIVALIDELLAAHGTLIPDLSA
jgi:alpha-galactosidase